MVKVPIRGKTPVKSPGNGNKKGVRIPKGGLVQPEQPLSQNPVQKEKGILQRMWESIIDDIHGRERKDMVDQEEILNDWKGQF